MTREQQLIVDNIVAIVLMLIAMAGWWITAHRAKMKEEEIETLEDTIDTQECTIESMEREIALLQKAVTGTPKISSDEYVESEIKETLNIIEKEYPKQEDREQLPGVNM